MTDTLFLPTPENIRDGILRVDRSGLIARGVANPNVTSSSDYWIRAESLSQHIAPLYANQQARVDASMPDTAEGEDLTRWIDIFGLSPREAQPSSGNIVFATSANSFVATGTQLVDSVGQTYQVTVGGTYANGALIPVQAISVGFGTNHPQGTALQWIGGPAFASAIALVAIGGLTGGADVDTEEVSRNRLFTYFRNPPQGGNWAQVKGWAEANPSIQAAYVYPALNGPATWGLCVVGPLVYDVTNFWSRGVPDAVLNAVKTYVQARMPEHSDLVATTPKDVGGATPNIDTSVSVGLSLPLSALGGGPGGGWIDAVPWPNLLGAATRVYVSAVTSSTVFTLTSDDAATTPAALQVVLGQTQIAWFSSVEYAAGNDPIITATITTVTGVTGALIVTINKPFTGIAINDFVMPNAENIQAYGRAYLASFNDMGPGQWTSNAQVLIRGKRRPLVTSSNPSDIGSTLLRALTDVGDEVLDAAFLYRSVSTPSIPPDTTVVSPRILVPKTFGLYDRIP